MVRNVVLKFQLGRYQFGVAGEEEMGAITAAQVLEAIRYYLPYLTLLFVAKYLLENLITATKNRFNSDIESIPSPPVSPWARYTVGHNFLYMLFFHEAMNVSERFNRWRREYGPIYQIRMFFGERGVIVMSESAIRTVNISKVSSFVKPAAVRQTLSQLIGKNGIILAEGAQHTRLRRAVAPSMHHSALASVGNVFLEHGRLLAERLAAMGETGGDVLRDVRISTFAVIFQTSLGKNAASQEVFTKLQEAYLTAFLEPPLRQLCNALLMKVLWFADDKFFSYREDLKRYIRDTVFELCEERRKRCDSGEAVEPSLLSLMVDEESNKGIENQEMVETLLSFLTAGQVTTSLSVCWALYLLAREPHWQELLVQELQDWSEDDGLDALNQLPLLDRIVRESIRLYPPVFFSSRQSTEAVVIDGYKLPKGTIVRLPILALHRNQDIWGPDANEFNPERFLREGEIARTKMYICVFLFGARSCIGQRFAWLEIKAFVAQVLKRQRVFLKPLEDPAPRCYGAFATPIGMKVYFRKR